MPPEETSTVEISASSAGRQWGYLRSMLRRASSTARRQVSVRQCPSVDSLMISADLPDGL
jgi:aspartyl aminopeptidase